VATQRASKQVVAVHPATAPAGGPLLEGLSWYLWVAPPMLPAAQGGHRSPTTVALHRIPSGGPLVAAFDPAGSYFWLTPFGLERVVV
jgi:hypothetical protein